MILMRNLVLGAGASYDSLPSFPPVTHSQLTGRPPLANDLFADRPVLREALTRFPTCHAIVPYLRSLRLGSTLESILGELRAEAVDHPARLPQQSGAEFPDLVHAAGRHRLQCAAHSPAEAQQPPPPCHP